jgi:glycerol kinase
MAEPLILVLDIGTTNIKAFLFNKNAEIVAQARRRQEYIMDEEPGQVEQNPQDVWKKCKDSITEVLTKVGSNEVLAMGLTTYRASFLFWNIETGETYSNVVTWQDNRSAEYAEKMTDKFGIKAIRAVGKIASTFTSSTRMLTASMIKFDPSYPSASTGHYLEENPELKRLIEFPNTKIRWGTIESYILWQLTGGKIHATDYSCASATGLLDPFKLEWNPITMKPFGIPEYILPEVRETKADYGKTTLFDVGDIPIKAVIADQQASLFGQGCFNYGDMKITNGTGSFVDLNTGDQPVASKRFLYPMVAWVIDGKTTYLLEGMSHNTGNIIDWISHELGFFDDPAETEQMALSVNSTGGVYFVPAFTTGLSFPWWDPTSRGGVFGISMNTKKEHIVRAVLEGICFRVKDIADGILEDTEVDVQRIKADGGVSQNKFILQFLADLLGIEVEHSADFDTTALGAAFIAGLGAGLWKDKEELLKVRHIDKVFTPQITDEEREIKYEIWKDIISRSLNYRH